MDHARTRGRAPRTAAATPRLAAGLLVLALAAAPAAAWARPDITGGIGRTFSILGDVNVGGAALSLEALWPVRPAWSAGVSIYADDMGQTVERLLDPNDGTDLGAQGGPSRIAFGAGWAVDVHPAVGAGRGRFGALRRVFVDGSAGFVRVRDSRRGVELLTEDAFGFSLGAGWRFPVSGRVEVGPSIRYHRVFDDRLGRFVSGGIDWAWR